MSVAVAELRKVNLDSDVSIDEADEFEAKHSGLKMSLSLVFAAFTGFLPHPVDSCCPSTSSKSFEPE